MIHNFKILRLALAAVFALSAISVSAASATPAEFTSESGTTTLHGSQITQNVLTTTGGNVKCNTATFKTTTPVGTTALDVTVKPTYSSCTAIGQTSTINMNGCEYTITPTSQTTGTFSFVNCAGNISVTSGDPVVSCTVTFTPTTPLDNTLDFTASGAGKTRDILVTSTLKGFSHIVDGPNGERNENTICGRGDDSAITTSGTITGTITIKGFSNEALTTQAGIFIDEKA